MKDERGRRAGMPGFLMDEIGDELQSGHSGAGINELRRLASQIQNERDITRWLNKVKDEGMKESL